MTERLQHSNIVFARSRPGGLVWPELVPPPASYRHLRYALVHCFGRDGLLLIFQPFKIKMGYTEEHMLGEVDTPYTFDELPGLQWAQRSDMLLLTHAAHPPARFLRQSETEFLYEPLPEWPAAEGCPAVCAAHNDEWYVAATDAKPHGFWRIDPHGRILPFHG